MVLPSTLLSTTLYPIVATAAVVQTIKAVWPAQGKGHGKSVMHWHYKGRSNRVAIKHAHPGGGISHMHRGMPGYGRKRGTLRR